MCSTLERDLSRIRERRVDAARLSAVHGLVEALSVVHLGDRVMMLYQWTDFSTYCRCCCCDDDRFAALPFRCCAGYIRNLSIHGPALYKPTPTLCLPLLTTNGPLQER